MSEKSDEPKKIPRKIEAILILLVIILMIIAAIPFYTVSNIPFKMTVNESEKDHIDVYVSNISTQQPLPFVQIGIYSYDKNTLLAGPLFTNESGLVFFEIPNGYDDRFRVQGINNGITYTQYIDKRSIFVKLDEYFGTSIAAFWGAIFTIICGIIIGYVKRDTLKSLWGKIPKIGKGKDEL